MTVRELRQRLDQLEIESVGDHMTVGDMTVIVSRDAEGNRFSPLEKVECSEYCDDGSTSRAYVMNVGDAYYTKDNAVILWPQS